MWGVWGRRIDVIYWYPDSLRFAVCGREMTGDGVQESKHGMQQAQRQGGRDAILRSIELVYPERAVGGGTIICFQMTQHVDQSRSANGRLDVSSPEQKKRKTPHTECKNGTRLQLPAE